LKRGRSERAETEPSIFSISDLAATWAGRAKHGKSRVRIKALKLDATGLKIRTLASACRILGQTASALGRYE